MYLAITATWSYLAHKYWSDLLPVQRILTGAVVFILIEHIFLYVYYDNYNKVGAPSKVLLFLVTLLNAGRNAVSFFLLLIVSLGYSVVKPSLGPTMKKCILLAFAHFIFGFLYTMVRSSLFI